VKVEGYKNTRIRIAILQALKVEYPKPIDFKVLLFCMDTYGYPMADEDLRAHLWYLKEKGYVETEEKKGRGYYIMHAHMTAKGWDLYDGILKDGGIDAEL
jgi:hypothetical protein